MGPSSLVVEPVLDVAVLGPHLTMRKKRTYHLGDNRPSRPPKVFSTRLSMHVCAFARVNAFFLRVCATIVP